MGLFGGEKITLTLEKYNYAPGETIKGTVALKLKKPTKARKFEIEFAGVKVERQTGMGIGPTSSNRRQQQRVYLYHFKMPLGGEGEYQQGEYPFEITIPPDVKQAATQAEGKVGTAVTALKAISGVTSRIDWYVYAKLDVPMKLDVSKRQSIVLS
ncbi:MAG: hypothetical protein KAW45_08595 [Thermoplasmatales archaeon]|nr:hypothetical protein [Thermoplasmatales archaeon]